MTVGGLDGRWLSAERGDRLRSLEGKPEVVDGYLSRLCPVLRTGSRPFAIGHPPDRAAEGLGRDGYDARQDADYRSIPTACPGLAHSRWTAHALSTLWSTGHPQPRCRPAGRRRTPANNGAPGGFAPAHQFRSLEVQGVAACSLLFVNIRPWPESAASPSQLTTANSRDSRRIALFVVRLWSIRLCLGKCFWPGGVRHSTEWADDPTVGGHTRPRDYEFLATRFDGVQCCWRLAGLSRRAIRLAGLGDEVFKARRGRREPDGGQLLRR
jgi:hypothetical protein